MFFMLIKLSFLILTNKILIKMKIKSWKVFPINDKFQKNFNESVKTVTKEVINFIYKLNYVL